MAKIFDVVRKIWLISTPEEQVRQRFIRYLIDVVGYNPMLISVEHAFVLEGGKNLRADIVLFDRNGHAVMLVECKAASVKIGNDTFTQASKYNGFFKARYIVLTNGDNTYIFSTDDYVTYNSERGFPVL